MEIIHLGHNRSVAQVVNAALQEDVHGIAISSYQGGHVEIIGVNTYLAANSGSETGTIELSRSSEREKQSQIARLKAFKKRHAGKVDQAGYGKSKRRCNQQ